MADTLIQVNHSIFWYYISWGCPGNWNIISAWQSIVNYWLLPWVTRWVPQKKRELLINHVGSHPDFDIARFNYPVLFTLIMVCLLFLCHCFGLVLGFFFFFSISIYNYFYSVFVSCVYFQPNMKGVSDITNK